MEHTEKVNKQASQPLSKIPGLIWLFPYFLVFTLKMYLFPPLIEHVPLLSINIWGATGYQDQ